MRLQNQFSSKQLPSVPSQILKLQKSHHKNNSKQLPQINQKKNENYQSQISFKLQYYQQLKQNNHKMIQKIKLINQGLDEQVKAIENKIISKLTVPKNRKGRVSSQRKVGVEKKYIELDFVKKQVQMKQASKRSHSILDEKLNLLKNTYKQKYVNMQQLEHKLKQLKRYDVNGLVSQSKSKMLEKQQISNQSLKQQIAQLKNSVRKQNYRIYAQKQGFIDNNRKKNNSARKSQSSNSKNKNNKSFMSDDQELTPEVKKLKYQYQTIGKRIQTLKIQKLALSLRDDPSQRKRYLHHLQSKIVQLNKLYNPHSH